MKNNYAKKTEVDRCSDCFRISVALLADQSQQASQFELVPKIVFSSNRQNPTCSISIGLEPMSSAVSVCGPFRPGDYSLFTIEGLDESLWPDPEFLERNEAAGKTIHMSSGGHESIKLTSH